jgi:hypothetical protein
MTAANTPVRQAFEDCLRLRELAERQTLTRKDNADLERIADRLHALAVIHEKERA